MDMSKLPRMSQSPAPPPPDDPSTSATQSFNQRVEIEPTSSSMGEIWISIALGAILLFLVPTTLQYACSKMFGTTFAPFADPTLPAPAKCDFIMYTDGTKVFYRDMPNFWSDLVVTLFAVVLIIDGLLLMVSRKRPLLLIGFGITILATAANLIYLLATYSKFGLPLMSALAVIFGVYIAIQQWQRLGSSFSPRRPRTLA
jgi:hypothetical protein